MADTIIGVLGQFVADVLAAYGKYGIRPRRGHFGVVRDKLGRFTPDGDGCCAVGVAAIGLYRGDNVILAVMDKYGLSARSIESIEAGFDGIQVSRNDDKEAYACGCRIAAAVGLPGVR